MNQAPASIITPETINTPISPNPAPETYTLSTAFTHLIGSPEDFRPVIAERMCRLQNTLANLNPKDRRQAICDIVYLKAVLEGKEGEAQGLAEAVWKEGA